MINDHHIIRARKIQPELFDRVAEERGEGQQGPCLKISRTYVRWVSSVPGWIELNILGDERYVANLYTQHNTGS